MDVGRKIVILSLRRKNRKSKEKEEGGNGFPLPIFLSLLLIDGISQRRSMWSLAGGTFYIIYLIDYECLQSCFKVAPVLHI